MITRVDDFFAFLGLDAAARERGLAAAASASARSANMMDVRDYEALAAVALFAQPRRIFEIGTYLGVTSDFLLALLPGTTLVSIAYVNPRWKLVGRRYNNSELPPERVGSGVHASRRPRFVQLLGDSHRLEAASVVREHGRFDLVLVDGDHTRAGVRQDTDLALAMLASGGTVAWHDANPKPAYLDVRRFLEQDLASHAIATRDVYVGGIAAWSDAIAARLRGEHGRSSVTFALERADLPEALALVEALDAYQRPLYPAESHHGIDTEALLAPNVLFALARKESGEAVACGAVVLGRDYGEVKRMYVRPDCRGSGVARALLAFLEARARAAGCTRFAIETGVRQPEALRLYASAGYERCAPFGDYVDDPHSLFMQKTAASSSFPRKREPSVVRGSGTRE
jgi:putative acetyltransferase